MKRLLIVFFSIISMPATLAIMGVILPHSIFAVKNKKNSDFSLWITSNGAHTGYLFPLQKTCSNWSEKIDFARFSLREPKYIHFGWGERDFYRNTPSWDEFKVSEGLRALFRSEHSAMHVTLRKTSYRGETIHLQLNRDQCKRISEYIERSFLHQDNTLLVPILDGYGPNDFFYASRLQYSWLFTCNSWTAEGLRSIELPTPKWSALAPAVLYHLSP